MRWKWLIPVAVLTLAWAVLGLWLKYAQDGAHDYSETAKGSPEYAAKWREVFDGVADPDDAHAHYPEVQFKRFGKGEWVFGVSRDSHRFPDGGTIVVKDSTGRVRAFFGHVCGPGRLAMMMDPATSLEEFYNSPSLKQFQLQEHQFQ